ncbi:MAG TPA: SAM-dependent methyltransferase [Thermoplasmata archaeon]|nr:SAM-dependent methyltransferase [Thermoplasmata archaeon]
MPGGSGRTDTRDRRDPAEPILESEAAREQEVRRRLSEAARPAGWLRFDRFMETALYASGVGFYTEPEAGFGPAGSFYTAAHVTPIFGRTVAQRIWAEYARLERPATFTVVEVGCGDGTMSVDVVRSLAERLREGDSLRYVLVERSPALRARALDRANPVAVGTGVELRAAEALSSDGPFEGVVLANELLDALPVRRLVRRGPAWRELAVRISDGPIEWQEEGIVKDPAAPPPGAAEEGGIVEVSPMVPGFFRELADHLTRGVALILDYGGEEAALVRDHPKGTLAAVRHHRPMPDPLAHPGLFDLSAFVNFTRARAAARSAGLQEQAFRPQAEALVSWGLERLTEAAVQASEGPEETVRTRLAVKNLLFGFSTFWALEVSPDAPTAPSASVGRA